MPDNPSEPQKDDTAPVSRVLPASWEYPLYYRSDCYQPPHETGLPPTLPIAPEKIGDAVVNAYVSVKDDDGFVVRWEGADGPQGSGIDHYDVQVRVQNGFGEEGPWADWKTFSTENYGMYYPDQEGVYYFRCRAVDSAGNVEEWPDAPDTQFVVIFMVHALGPDMPQPGLPDMGGHLMDDDPE